LVCKDFEEAHKGKNAITVQTAKNKINHLLAEWVKLNKEDHYSGVLVSDARETLKHS
jgi:hypothetical protein